MPRSSTKPAVARKKLLDRIKRLEAELAKAREYLETGKHAHWHGFRPLFNAKARDGAELPPHRDWVKNVFLRQTEAALDQAERELGKLESRHA